ncbi:MAG: LCP family protein [Oscillospiraceae bacterium]|nr:LCP family protein [Oscillospiraceae bacterium]
MKLFGNTKRSAPAKAAKRTADAPLIKEQPQEITESRLQPHVRAILLMLGAICLFAGAVAMCFMLISQSAEVNALPQEDPKPIRFVAGGRSVLPPSTEDVPVEYEVPKSKNNSNRLNVLLIGIDEATDLSNMLMLASIDLNTKDVALLSIPRETYISGNFKYPAAFNVYKEAEGGAFGIKSVVEKVKEMIGFQPDYYFVFNTASLNGLLDLTGNIEFEVPEEPAYSNLAAGRQSVDGAKAIKLLNYRNDYYEISTEPARVQRMFLQKLLTKLLQDSEHIDENARAIAAFADTDLSSNDLAFLGHLFQGLDMNGIYSRALPGEVVEAGGAYFFQVDPNEAVVMLNEHFNPLDKELTVFDLNFRQVAGDSGEGEYAAYGFGNGRNNTVGNDDDDEDETQQTDATEATEPTEETQPPEETEDTGSESPETP